MDDDVEWEVWREVWRITERRDGCVYRTESIGHEWVPMGSHGDGADLIYTPAVEYKNPRRKQ